jgi:DNA repair protein RadC
MLRRCKVSLESPQDENREAPARIDWGKKAGLRVRQHFPAPDHRQNGTLIMADMNSTASHPSKARRRVASKPRSKGSEALPAFGLTGGSLSFREGLAAYEVDTLDRALAIVGRTLRTPRAAMCSPDAVKEYMRLALGGESAERFGVMYLDSQLRAIAFEIVFNGTLTRTSVFPREIIRAALAHGAASVILAHNHPSGAVTPSTADVDLTQRLKAALALVDMQVLDHVIVGGDQALSMAAVGLI